MQQCHHCGNSQPLTTLSAHPSIAQPMHCGFLHTPQRLSCFMLDDCHAIVPLFHAYSGLTAGRWTYPSQYKDTQSSRYRTRHHPALQHSGSEAHITCSSACKPYSRSAPPRIARQLTQRYERPSPHLRSSRRAQPQLSSSYFPHFTRLFGESILHHSARL